MRVVFLCVFSCSADDGSRRSTGVSQGVSQVSWQVHSAYLDILLNHRKPMHKIASMLNSKLRFITSDNFRYTCFILCYNYHKSNFPEVYYSTTPTLNSCNKPPMAGSKSTPTFWGNLVSLGPSQDPSQWKLGSLESHSWGLAKDQHCHSQGSEGRTYSSHS